VTLSLAFRRDIGGSSLRYRLAIKESGPSHVAVVFDTDQVDVDETSGVRSLLAANRLGTWQTVTTPVGPVREAIAKTFAANQLGKPFDRDGLMAAWRDGQNARDVLADRWSPSEFVAAVLLAAGVDLPVKRPAYWTPRRLWDFSAPWRG